MAKVITIPINGEEDSVIIQEAGAGFGIRDCVFFCEDPSEGGIVTTTYCEYVCCYNEKKDCPLFKKKRALLLNTNY